MQAMHKKPIQKIAVCNKNSTMSCIAKSPYISHPDFPQISNLGTKNDTIFKIEPKIEKISGLIVSVK